MVLFLVCTSYVVLGGAFIHPASVQTKIERQWGIIEHVWVMVHAHTGLRPLRLLYPRTAEDEPKKDTRVRVVSVDLILVINATILKEILRKRNCSNFKLLHSKQYDTHVAVNRVNFWYNT